jgi:transcriptional regulator GlxA family with amidase domain
VVVGRWRGERLRRADSGPTAVVEEGQESAPKPSFHYERRARHTAMAESRLADVRSPLTQNESALKASERGALGVGDAAAGAGLSMRQFERRFSEQVGVSPKLYARVVRFNAALEAKMNAPRRLWTDIAHDLGYYDQMHLVRDFEDFTCENPTAFIRRLHAMPESWA